MAFAYVPSIADCADAPLYSTVNDQVRPEGIGVDVSSAVCNVPVPLVVKAAPLNLKVDIVSVFVVGMDNNPLTVMAPVAVAL